MDVLIIQDGRNYRLGFSISGAELDKRRQEVGFILANFATSGVNRPCCADAVSLP